MKLWTTLLALSLLLGGCSDSPESSDPTAKQIEVSVGSGPRIDIQSQTRTELEGDDGTVRWSDNDRIALWAKNSANEMQFSATTFELWHYNAQFNSAKFTATISEMPQDTYIYYAVSPIPASTSGTVASFAIPSTQDGAYHGDYDVMVATPVTSGALTEGDNSEAVSMAFTHKVHLLKIRIPSNALGEQITGIELTFPTAVTGTLQVDAADPTATPTLTNGSNVLTLNFAEPKGVGDVVYATIAPTALTYTDEITMKSFCDLGESTETGFTGKDFAAGHTTPIAYNIPAMGKPYTVAIVKLSNTGETTLGEKINTFTLTAPAGSTFDNGLNTRTFTVNGTGDYKMILKDFAASNLSGKTITVNYESENAIVSTSFTAQLTESASNTIATLSVPYLLAEDFSSINQTTGSDDYPGVGGTSIVDGNRSAVDLSSWGLSTSGWTSARVGVAAGKAVRICARVENQQVKANTYNARIDSAPFSGIKPGKSINVTVSYNYKGGRYSACMKISWVQLVDDGPGNGNGIYSYGYTTTQGWIGGSNGIEHTVASGITLPNTAGSDRNSNQNYDNISYSNSFTIPAAGNTHRASWLVSSTMDNRPVAGANGNFWLYLDNIKVSIAQ